MRFELPADAPVAKNFVLEDKRNLAYFDNGIAGDAALLFHHGTPGLGNIWQIWFEAAAAKGVRAISYTKAGYPGSDRAQPRNIAEASTDFLQLLEHLGVTSFVSVGWSGGGPYALHSTFSPNCKGADLIAGVAPYVEMGQDFLTGQAETETYERLDRIASSREASIAEEEKDHDVLMNAWTFEAFQGFAKESPRFAALETEFTRFNKLVPSALLNALIPDSTGSGDDNHMILTDWGFRVNEVTKPVGIWNGMRDQAVPPGHALYQHSQIANSDLHLFRHQGHASIYVESMHAILASAIEKLNA